MGASFRKFALTISVKLECPKRHEDNRTDEGHTGKDEDKDDGTDNQNISSPPPLPGRFRPTRTPPPAKHTQTECPPKAPPPVPRGRCYVDGSADDPLLGMYCES